MLPTSLWTRTAELPEYPRLTANAQADVAVIGGGIAGLTVALLLQRAGQRVALIEALRIGAGETGHTTAHLTELVDARYSELESKLGRERAALVAASSRAAIDRIESFSAQLAGGAHFDRVPAYLYAETPKQRSELERELESLKRAGMQAEWLEELPLPFRVQGAIRVEAQAQFHPLEYLHALARELVRIGGRIFEHTRMLGVSEGQPCRIKTEGSVLSARHVLVLTNVPVNNRFALHTKIAAYRSYAIAARLEAETFPAGLFYDMHDPYRYVRAQRTDHGPFLIVGGADHKTGQKRETEECYRELEQYTRDLLGYAAIEHRWSGQIIEPADKLPFIGRNTGSRHVYVATGFSGTGMTFGTLAAMLLRDAVLGAKNPWAELYGATRVKPLAQVTRYLSENVDYPTCMLRDRLHRGEVDSIDQVVIGEGRLVRDCGRMLAVYRDDEGRVHARSAVCTHMGCYVRFNSAERTWDCPCHGSRFDVDGGVINGPAVRGLPEPSAEPATERPEPYGVPPRARSRAGA